MMQSAILHRPAKQSASSGTEYFNYDREGSKDLRDPAQDREQVSRQCGETRAARGVTRKRTAGRIERRAQQRSQYRRLCLQGPGQEHRNGVEGDVRRYRL